MPGSQRERDTLEHYKSLRPDFGQWQWVRVLESELPELKTGFATRPDPEDDYVQLHIRNGYCPCKDCDHEYMYECENTDIDREDGTTEECCHNFCT